MGEVLVARPGTPGLQISDKVSSCLGIYCLCDHGKCNIVAVTINPATDRLLFTWHVTPLGQWGVRVHAYPMVLFMQHWYKIQSLTARGNTWNYLMLPGVSSCYLKLPEAQLGSSNTYSEEKKSISFCPCLHSTCGSKGYQQCSVAPGPISFVFMQFMEKMSKLIGWHPQPLGLMSFSKCGVHEF